MKTTFLRLMCFGLLFSHLAVTAADTQLVDRRYSVAPGFPEMFELPSDADETFLLSSVDGPSEDRMKAHLSARGIPFPTGSRIRYSTGTSRLRMLNTPAAHAALKAFLVRTKMIFVQVSLEVKVLQLRGPGAARLERAVSLTQEHFERLKTADVKVLDAISVVTRSGQNATSSHARSDQAPASEGLQQESNPFGTELCATPTIGLDGKTLNATLMWSCTLPACDQAAKVGAQRTNQLNTTVEIQDGDTLVLQSRVYAVPSATASDKQNSVYEYVTLTARLVDAAGEPVRSGAPGE